MTEEQIIQAVRDLSWPASLAFLGYILLRPFIPTAIDWLRGKMKGQQINEAYDTAIMAELKLIKGNHFQHLEAAMEKLSSIASDTNRIALSVKEATDRIERKVENLK